MDIEPFTSDLIDEVIAGWGIDFAGSRRRGSRSSRSIGSATLLDTSARTVAPSGLPRFAARLQDAANGRRAGLGFLSFGSPRERPWVALPGR